MKKFVISPEAINVLGAGPEFHSQHVEKPQPLLQPQPPERSFWQKAVDFSIEVDAFIKPVIAVCGAFALTTNSVTRYKKASRAGSKGAR